MAENVGEKRPLKNFWLWGTWGKRKITNPFLTQKVCDKVRDIIIGQSFIVALQEDGTLVSWGEDKSGCLGLGNDKTNSADPEKIYFAANSDENTRIVDVQFGRHHLIALTDKGRVFTWGENGGGQLGLGDLQTRFEPTLVEDLKAKAIKQVLAVDNMSYALDTHGVVYAWGDNAGGQLGLEHESPKVPHPEPILRFHKEGTEVKRLMVKDSSNGGKGGKVIVACVGMSDTWVGQEMPGTVARPLHNPDNDVRDRVLSRAREREIFEGVDLMRKVMDKLLEDWRHIVEMGHGSPYDDQGIEYDHVSASVKDNCTLEQLDRFVDLENLKEAEMRIQHIIDANVRQIYEVRNREKGTRNIQCVLSVFVDMCRLRKEKIKSTILTRQLQDMKQGIDGVVRASDLNSASEGQRLTVANDRLKGNLDKLRMVEVPNMFAGCLRDSIAECIECRLEVHSTQLEHMKAVRGEPANLVEPALQVVKERWIALRNASVYKLYSDFTRDHTRSFRSDEELMTHLCQRSDAALDHIIHTDQDRLISRDLLVPSLCYDLLVENAELRKMCNAYQLRVLVMRQQHDKDRSARSR